VRATQTISTRQEQLLRLLRDYESPNVTFLSANGRWPIVWDRARGVHIWDTEGRRYLDLTAAFGVAAAGHANPRVIAAGQAQMGRLLHAMGDVHPHPRKAELARELSRITFERWTSGVASHAAVATGKTIFCNSGFEAVEAALKTAVLATGRSDVVAFEGAYHGLGYGALNATSRDFFRRPFQAQLRRFGHFVPYPSAATELRCVEAELNRTRRRGPIGAVLVEPVQGRGGIRVPPAGLLSLLRRWCDAHGALLIVDEIYTGFGRTGRWFACEHDAVVPDVICLGKALAGGFPIAACVGRADLMDAAWPRSHGEAIHTSTFLGHPVGCAMALAQIREIDQRHLCERSAQQGRVLLAALQSLGPRRGKLRLLARGLGLMAGLEVTEASGRPASDYVFPVVQRMLERGYLLLPEGDSGEVLGFTPPLIISARALVRTVEQLDRALRWVARL
jgi:4-aminobutyrate aminotransferase-like enzyme